MLLMVIISLQSCQKLQKRSLAFLCHLYIYLMTLPVNNHQLTIASTTIDLLLYALLFFHLGGG
jgi:hypothetical protein